MLTIELEVKRNKLVSRITMHAGYIARQFTQKLSPQAWPAAGTDSSKELEDKPEAILL